MTAAAEQVRFSRSLYAVEAVEAAIAAFDGLGTFGLTLLPEAIEVTVSEPDPDVADVLIDEFCNHALSHSIAKGLGAHGRGAQHGHGTAEGSTSANITASGGAVDEG